MLKKKICQLLAAVMITTTVMGSNVHAVWATERTDVIDVRNHFQKRNSKLEHILLKIQQNILEFNIINRYKHG